MSKIPILATLVVAFATLPASAEPILGDTAACEPGAQGPALLVTVHGFKDRIGRIRVQSYPDNEQDWLVVGKYIHRVETDVSRAGDMTLCFAVASPGRYALVALHDRDGDGKLSVWSDGFGFSRNPVLHLSKPRIGTVAVTVGPGVTPLKIVLNYRQGLFGVGPMAP